MKTNPDQPQDAAGLRRRAKDRLQTRERNPQSAQRLLHELQVHQTELEMQNEELRRAQHELEVSREKYFDLYDLAPVGYLTLNEPGLILEANLTAARLLGVARTDLLQQPLTRFILREDLGIFHQHRQQLFETRAPQSCELRLTRPGGAPFWVRGQAILARDHKTGAPVCRMTLSDITARKQAEETMTRQLEILNATPDFIGFADARDTRIRYINPAGRKMIGWGAEEDVTRLKIAEVHPAWTNRLFREETLPIAIRDGVWKGECAFLHRDGREIPVTMVLLAHKSPGGKVERFSTISRDITERKQAEADLQRLAQFKRLAQLMKCASDIILLTDEHGRILEANDRALETYGYSLAELRQKTVEDLRTPEIRAELPHQIEQLETDGRSVFEAMNQRRDGAAFPVEISARFLEIAGVRYRLSMVRDITKRKRAEEDLRESEARFRELFNHMSSGVAVYEARNDGQDFVLKDFNQAAERIEATPREAVLGRSVVEVFPGVKEFGLLNVLQRVWRTGQPEHPPPGLYRDKHLAGWRENHVYKLPSGEIVAVYDDITERKQAEELLRVQHDLALALSNTSRLNEGLRLCLESVLNILGMECGGFYLVDRASGALDLAFHQGLSSDFVKAVAHYAADSANAKLVMAGKPVYSEYTALRVPKSEAKRREGLRVIAIVPVSHQAQVIGCLNIASHRLSDVPASARDSIEAVVAQTGNAIARLRAEEVLYASERKFHTLADNFPDIIARFDRQLRHIYVTPSIEQYTGLPAETFQGKRHEELGMPAKNVALWNKRLRRVIKTGERESFEFEFTNADRFYVFDTLLVPEFGKGGALESVVAIVRDITERKQAEKRVQMFSQEIIAAREGERKQVSSVLHHDVGSLTVGISAHLDAVEQDLRSGKPGEALQWMKRMRKLFNESVVRLKKLAIELRPPELDVLGLHAALRQYFSHVTERGGTRVQFRETLGRRRVSGGTATILFRVAQEALTNAITHGHATRVDVVLSASKKEVGLTIRNNGKGFNPSEQMARPTSQMGLRVMREMALSAGGVFTVDSGRGKRTTVRVRLPIAEHGQ